jgi:hypothetical protein
MGVPLTTAAMADLLDPRFRDIAMGTYEKGSSFIPEIFGVTESDRSQEMWSSLTPMGLFQNFTDTGTIGYDGPEQEYDVTASFIEWALGMQIRRTLYDDDQHGAIDEIFSLLGESAFKTHEQHAIGMISGSFSATNDYYTHTENVALCSNSHTTPVAGVSTTTGFDNLNNTALTPVSLKANRLQFRQFKDAAGDIINEIPNQLIVPLALEDTANEIVKSTLVPYETSNTTNVNENRFTIKVLPRLPDANDWWLGNTASMKKNLLWIWRTKLELGKMEAFDNYIAKARAYMRYGMVRRDWRCLIGNQVS